MLQNELPVTGHPLADTVARFTWLLPALPLLGFLVNGALSLRHAHGPSHDAAHDAHGDAERGHGDARALHPDALLVDGGG